LLVEDAPALQRCQGPEAQSAHPQIAPRAQHHQHGGHGPDARSQSSQAAQRAAELEAEASQFLDQQDRWAYAADLYMAAVQLRADDDPQAERDLMIAANLSYGTGDPTGAISALESGASRALASGDVVQAVNMFADAAWVAEKANRRADQRRLTSKVNELIDSSDLTTAERRQIQLRFRGS